jgi:hypothetical protein
VRLRWLAQSSKLVMRESFWLKSVEVWRR